MRFAYIKTLAKDIPGLKSNLSLVGSPTWPPRSCFQESPFGNRAVIVTYVTGWALCRIETELHEESDDCKTRGLRHLYTKQNGAADPLPESRIECIILFKDLVFPSLAKDLTISN